MCFEAGGQRKCQYMDNFDVLIPLRYRNTWETSIIAVAYFHGMTSRSCLKDVHMRLLVVALIP